MWLFPFFKLKISKETKTEEMNIPDIQNVKHFLLQEEKNTRRGGKNGDNRVAL